MRNRGSAIRWRDRCVADIRVSMQGRQGSRSSTIATKPYCPWLSLQASTGNWVYGAQDIRMGARRWVSLYIYRAGASIDGDGHLVRVGRRCRSCLATGKLRRWPGGTTLRPQDGALTVLPVMHVQKGIKHMFIARHHRSDFWSDQIAGGGQSVLDKGHCDLCCGRIRKCLLCKGLGRVKP